MDRRSAVVENESACSILSDAAVSLLSQCESLVKLLTDHAYQKTSTTMRGGTIGKHLRHTLDHYVAALAVLDDPAQCIDYDRRMRQTPVESDRGAAVRAIGDVRARLALAGGELVGREVRIRVMIDAAGTEAELGSTLGRELAFATHHAVHHQAMMRAIATEFGVEVPDEFGKAPSTVNAERGTR